MTPPAGPQQAVILLHGMGRTRMSMAVLGLRLRSAGYEVHRFGYSPRKSTLDELTAQLRELVESKVKAPDYHLIGHSLGNIIVRNGFHEGYRAGLKRIVMLAPPNGPAALAGMLRHLRLYQWLTGDSGQKLGDDEFYRTLPVPDVDFGVIAGNCGHRIGFHDANDGVVRVENTKLDGMRDWVEIDRTHTFIMFSEETFDLCLHFLDNGAFGPRRSARFQTSVRL